VASPAVPYLRRPAVVGIILGTFVVLTLPLALVKRLAPGAWPPVFVTYSVLTGLPHFFATFLIYAQKPNREYFAGTPGRLLSYGVVPVALLAGLATFDALEGTTAYPQLAAAVTVGILGADRLHASRQAFGVLQLLKGSWGLTTPGWLKLAENALMVLVALMMFETAAASGVFAPDTLSLATGGLAMVAGAAVAWGYFAAWRRGARAAVLLPVAYLAVQLGSMALAIWRSELYAATLAIHYVEYLVLMVPRCLWTPLSAEAWPDRALGALRRRPWVLGAALLALAGSAAVVRHLQKVHTGGPLPLSFLLHAYDGLFVFHYFVEAMVWRMSQPFYRRTLGPLYFPARV
jgi:hypothetical protein